MGTAYVARISSASGTRPTADSSPSCPRQPKRHRTVACRAGATTARPTPVIKIDNHSDAFATKIIIDLGDQVGEMLDMILSLKNLGLNIRRAKIAQEASQTTFFITDSSTSEKIVKSAQLEEIRMTVLTSLTSNFPETAASFNFGSGGSEYDSDNNDQLSPSPIRRVVPTRIDVIEADTGSCSILKIRTADRPGLLVDIVHVLKDLNLNVVSAEVETLGAIAQDDFFVTYRGEPLSTPMVTLVTNALQYYLSLGEVAKEESY